MSPLHAAQFGLDPYRFRPAPGLVAALRRRLGGRYIVDPFGLDPQLCDMLVGPARRVLGFSHRGVDRLPARGGAVLVANRGFGIGEPIALALAVAEATGRRLRFVAGPELGIAQPIARRLGGVTHHPADLTALLRAGHLVAVSLAPTWLRTGAGPPPLDACTAMLGHTVFPATVIPRGPLGLPIGRWDVSVGAHIALDATYQREDPLAAAELGEIARDAVAAMLAGGDLEATPSRADVS